MGSYVSQWRNGRPFCTLQILVDTLQFVVIEASRFTAGVHAVRVLPWLRELQAVPGRSSSAIVAEFVGHALVSASSTRVIQRFV
jgi:hypothetical protein